MLRAFCLALALVFTISTAARADEKFTVLLDWFLNPDNAPLFTAQYIGAFKQQGLDVTLIPPTDPSLPPREVAAGKADVAISYQPQLYQFAEQGLPLVRIGTSVDMPLNTLTTIKSSGITKMADFKGKKIGYSVAGEEDILVGVMLKNAGVDLKDVTLVNVNFNTVTAIMSHQVDGSIGDFRTGEVIELADKGQDPIPFYTEDNGIPMYDELVYIANKKDATDPKMARFLKAVQLGTIYLIDHPDEMWAAFIKAHPDQNSEDNKKSWYALIPTYAKNPFLLDTYRYETYGAFAAKNGIIKSNPPIGDYAIQLNEADAK